MQDNSTDWQPSASLTALRERAGLYSEIRAFFAERDVLEVETPLLAAHTVSDPHIESIASADERWLQTSPEFAMKRLLAAGSGCIYQICKAFRAGDSGRRHNNEFTMLEWYRVDFDDRALMREVDDLLRRLLSVDGESLFITYAELFQQHLSIDIHSCDVESLQQAVDAAGIELSTPLQARDELLDLLFSFCIQPQLQSLCFVYDYPASQAALARLGQDDNGRSVARRFECFYRGLELANGYDELRDAGQYVERQKNDLLLRVQAGQVQPALDTRFVTAMQAGLPACAGVAMGLDRVLMLRLGLNDIAEVLAFVQSRA
jgi:lysyl-tRNA synthetase class 2